MGTLSSVSPCIQQYTHTQCNTRLECTLTSSSSVSGPPTRSAVSSGSPCMQQYMVHLTNNVTHRAALYGMYTHFLLLYWNGWVCWCIFWIIHRDLYEAIYIIHLTYNSKMHCLFASKLLCKNCSVH